MYSCMMLKKIVKWGNLLNIAIYKTIMFKVHKVNAINCNIILFYNKIYLINENYTTHLNF